MHTCHQSVRCGFLAVRLEIVLLAVSAPNRASSEAHQRVHPYTGLVPRGAENAMKRTIVWVLLLVGTAAGGDDEIYGACAPDMFNEIFDPNVPVYVPGGLYELTHTHAEKVWVAARTGRERSLAVCYCSHSGVFGADRTAHHDGVTYGAGEGYVIAKAADMQAALAAIGHDLPTVLGLPLLPEQVELDSTTPSSSTRSTSSRRGSTRPSARRSPMRRAIGAIASPRCSSRRTSMSWECCWAPMRLLS